MTYRVTGKRVLCRPIDTEETMADFPSIIVPEEVREGLTADQAEVVAVGSGCQPGLKPGDWVVLRKWSKDDAPRQLGDGCFVVPEEAVLAVLDA